LAKDDAQAVIWYRKAAEAGSELAKSNLRRMGRL
jgi:TPR repeat protein